MTEEQLLAGLTSEQVERYRDLTGDLYSTHKRIASLRLLLNDEEGRIVNLEQQIREIWRD